MAQPTQNTASETLLLPDTLLLNVKDLRKSFGGVHALSGVSFSLKAGEVHALVGENGAGKSTLIKILTGVHHYDSGTIELSGEIYKPTGPNFAKEAGIQVVHQEFNLLTDLSVAENIAIESFPKTRFGLLDRAEMRRRARKALDAIGLSAVDVDMPVNGLGIAHRQLIEIARALQTDSRILILDEPTATLTERETKRLFEIVASIKAKGVTVVFVSHHLDEVFEICDRVTVFRNGETTATEDIANTTPDGVVRHMVGRKLAEQTKELNTSIGSDIVFSVKDLRTSANPNPQGISFDLRQGEILGIAGLVGSGRTEVLRAIFGVDPILGGQLYRNGAPVDINTPRDAIAQGFGFLTEDRKDEGLILDMSIAANTSLVSIRDVSAKGLLRFAEERKMVREGGARLQLKYGKISDAASSLSGGNQQKVVLAKWLASNPRILLLDEPTRGVDVGAKAEIYAILKALSAQGMSMIVVSSELTELITLTDRMLVMSEHRIQGSLTPENYQQEAILKLAYGQIETPQGHTK
ncbi:Ribose import ATP-binding protein RbsA (plasmid) [Pseudosulfitobacter sp. DSM 107133]|uniref:sugar ABC transporter ATP-binding protein n=1 Tax=Pseudosulfitobacter sp. DSM 107133 TaxID=2883100 RepID=UPI000DF1F958|nr:sugar ABC transporter ATP-binding protein [Pseudosulfitobacter sp. DSM 107133]UOA29182.1 Ribose import ATP-binding protein RbsA [Pseudosulfitobacter sp. DSM 107133]